MKVFGSVGRFSGYSAERSTGKSGQKQHQQQQQQQERRRQQQQQPAAEAAAATSGSSGRAASKLGFWNFFLALLWFQFSSIFMHSRNVTLPVRFAFVFSSFSRLVFAAETCGFRFRFASIKKRNEYFQNVAKLRARSAAKANVLKARNTFFFFKKKYHQKESKKKFFLQESLSKKEQGYRQNNRS